MDLDTSGFYFGRAYDLETKQADPEKPIFYNPADLTTHGVITGMTGSGKTGMGIILLEEAALKGIPAILIDPKGDLTNHLLHFPDLLPADFAAWVDEDAARRDGKTKEQAGEEAAASWKKGLSDWGIDKTRLERLAESVHYAVYTPGSNSAIPVSILSSLKAPKLDWEENKEVIRENISSTVTALLGLVGFKDIDPVRSREHILLSNIFENAWSHGEDLNLESLILQAQNPPFEKLGVVPLSKFFPEKDRFELSMLLNNFLAAPAFETWLEGQPLDIASMLWGPDGKPCHSVFYLAHLSDAERMFFITLLYSAVETWMRTQSGTSSLRALVYFDEIVGYLPPVANPPSKPIILRMLKQARAFGVGLVVATQNPIDLDYKALSNSGTWIIGKLQTDQDKQRLLDGLESVSGNLDRSYFDKTISALGKRVFLLHNINAKAPQVFTTRWAMNYLPGPVTRSKLKELNRMASAALPAQPAHATESPSAPSSAAELKSGAVKKPGQETEPRLDARTRVVYLPFRRAIQEVMSEASRQGVPAGQTPRFHYEPVILGQAQVYFANRTYDVDTHSSLAVRLPALQGRGLVQWQDYLSEPVDLAATEAAALANATFGALAYPFDDEKTIAELEKDFADWVFRSNSLTLFTHDKLKLTSKPGESRQAFEARCSQAGSATSGAAEEKIRAKYEKLKEAIRVKKMKEELELEKDKKIWNQRRMEEAGTGLSTVASLLGGRKKSLNSSLTKRRMTSTAKSNVEESEEMLKLYEQQLAELDEKMTEELASLKTDQDGLAVEIREVKVTPLKKDIVIESFGLAWMPYYVFEQGETWIKIPGF